MGKQIDESYLVDEETILAELSNFTDETPTRFLPKLKELCILYDHKCDEFAMLWISFINNNKYNGKEMDDKVTAHFERELYRQAESRSMIKVKSENIVKSEAKISKDFGSVLDDDIDMENFSNDAQIIDTCQDFQIIETLGNSEPCVKQWTNDNKDILNPKSETFDPNTSPKYMKMSTRKFASSFDYILDQYIQTITNKLDIKEIGDVSRNSVSSEYFIGRIMNTNANEKFNEKNVFLEFSQNSEQRHFQCVKLNIDITKVDKFSIFPGQLICIKGLNDLNHGIAVEEIIASSVIPSTLASLTALNSPIHIVSASGPFFVGNTDNYQPLKKLLKYVTDNKPHLLYLVGPFTNEFQANNLDRDKIFGDIHHIVYRAIKDIVTKVVFIPSEMDSNSFIQMSTPSQYSIPTSLIPDCPSKMIYLSNPSMLDIAGIKICGTSTDIILHLLRDEISNKYATGEPGQRITRLCEHLLSQRSFYPLYPPHSDVNMDFSKMNQLEIKNTPHVFITPSNVKHFIKNVHGCLFVNPERIVKGYFTRILIENSEVYAQILKL